MPRQKQKKKKKEQHQTSGQELYDQALKAPTSSVKAELLKKAMKAGHLEANAEYGLMLCHGDLGPSNPQEAIKIWRAAGKRGCGRSNWHAGMLAKQSGHFEVAVKLWTDSANDGCAEANVGLGILYLDGVGVAEDPAAGAEFFRRGLQCRNQV